MTVALDLIGISIQLVSTFLAALAYVWQKKSHLRMALSGSDSWSSPENKSAQRLWRLGFGLMVIAACLDLATYPMLDLSKQAPLGAVTLVFNSILASVLLSEPFTVLDLISTIMIFAGTITAVANSEAESATWTFDEILGLLDDNLVKIYSAIMIPGLIAAILFVEKTSKTAPVSWTRFQRSAMAFLAPMAGGCCMGFTGYFAKSLSTVVSQLDFPALKNPFFWLYALLAVISVTGQLRYLNKGLEFFDALQVVPIFQCFIIFSNALAGIVYFHDMRNSEPYKLILFAVGGGVCIAGIALLLLKKSGPDHGHAAAVVVVAAASKESRRESLVDGTADPWAAPGAVIASEHISVLTSPNNNNNDNGEFTGYKPSAPESLTNPAEVDLMSSLQRRIWGAQSRAKAAVIGLYQTASASATSSTGAASTVVAAIMPSAAGYSNANAFAAAKGNGEGGDDEHDGQGLLDSNSNSSNSGIAGGGGLLSSISRRRSAGGASPSQHSFSSNAVPAIALQHSVACNVAHGEATALAASAAAANGASSDEDVSSSSPSPLGSPEASAATATTTTGAGATASAPATASAQCPACQAGFAPGVTPPATASSGGASSTGFPLPLHPNNHHHQQSLHTPHGHHHHHHGHHHHGAAAGSTATSSTTTVTSSNGNVVGSVPSFRRSTTSSRDLTGRSRAGSIAASAFAAFSTAISMSDVVAAASAAETLAAAQTATGLPPSLLLHGGDRDRSASTPSAQQSPRFGGMSVGGSGTGSGSGPVDGFSFGGDGGSNGGPDGSGNGGGGGVAAISVRQRGRSRVNTGGSLAVVEEESGTPFSPAPPPAPASVQATATTTGIGQPNFGGSSILDSAKQQSSYGTASATAVSFDFGGPAGTTTTVQPPPGLGFGTPDERDPWAASGTVQQYQQTTGGSSSASNSRQGTGGSGFGFSTPHGHGNSTSGSSAAPYFAGAVTPADSAAAIVAPPTHPGEYHSPGAGMSSSRDSSPLRTPQDQASSSGSGSRQSSFRSKTRGKAWHEVEVKDIVQAGWKRYGPAINKFLGRKPTEAGAAGNAASSSSASAALAGDPAGLSSESIAVTNAHNPSTPSAGAGSGRASGPRGSAGGSYSAFNE